MSGSLYFMSIQQHPLPQDISSYKFRLIGDMTIKQFVYLAVFIVIGIILYNLPLPPFFRLPLSFISILLGIGIAFVPFQGRSLEQWIIAFIKSIYSPTQYIWQQSDQRVDGKSPATPKPNNLETTTTNKPTQQAPAKETPSQSPDESSIDVPKVIQKTKNITQPTDSVTTNQPPPQPATTTNLPVPLTPTTPNTLVGLTISPTSQILDGVMVEIKNQDLTLRATKSNRLGQFMFARPLENGTYQISAEKEGYTFDSYSFDLTGDIVKPLKIQATQNV